MLRVLILQSEARMFAYTTSNTTRSLQSDSRTPERIMSRLIIEANVRDEELRATEITRKIGRQSTDSRHLWVLS